MAIKKSFRGASIRKPGAYSFSTVDQSGGAPLDSNGTLFLIGEAESGKPGDTGGIQAFSASQMGALIAEFGSGPLVDAARAALNASKTPGVQGPDKILCWKTNSSTQASNQLQNATPANLIQLKAKKWGQSGNYLTVEVAAGTDSARQRLITIRDKRNVVTETLDQNAAVAQLSIDYTGAGSACTLTIAGASENAKTLTTSVTGASGENLSFNLKDYTMKDLVDAINLAAGGVYTAVLLNTQTGTVLKGTELDPVTATSIMSVTSFYRLQNELVELINDNSALVEASKSGIVTGVPAASAEAYLTGGAKGASSNSDFSDGMAASLSEDYGVCVPCISRDATGDISDAMTDSSSSYTIASVVAALDSHLRLRGSIKNRKEAQGMAGIRNAAKASCYAQATSLNSELVQLTMQDVLVVGSDGSLSWKQPHVMAAMLAGMRLGTDVGTPLTHKYLNCSGIGHVVNPDTGLSTGDFDPAMDLDTAIDAGMTFAEKASGGYRVVVDNTTYGKDQSFVFNRGSVMQASQFVAKTIRETAELVFVGTKVSNGSAASIKSVLRSKLIELNKANIITGSDDAPQGFVEKTFTVTIQGNTASVSVEVKPVQGLDFILIEFTLGDIKQSA